MRIPRIVLAVLLVGTPIAGVVATTSTALADPMTYSSVDITDGTACALTFDGTAMCWGSNRDSWLIGASRNEVIDLPTPVLLPNNDRFVSLNGGGNHTWCGLAISGTVFCWGEHHIGNYFITSSKTPVPVQFPTTTPITQVGSGYAIGCALNTNNELWCWGDILETGSGETEPTRTPVLVPFPNNEFVTSFDLGGIPCATTNLGNVYCWAHQNGAGQLGVGYQSTTPYAVSVVPQRVLTPAGLQFVSVNSGYEHVCALTNTGAGYCWGDNYDGLFGNNSYLDSYIPTRMLPPNDEPIARISTASYHTCILTISNKTFCVGRGDYGEFGTGTTLGGKTFRSPVLPEGIYFTHITTSGSGTCGIDQNSTVWCFGLLSRFIATSSGVTPSLFPQMIPAVGSPTVATNGIASISAEEATVLGSVNGNGYATTTRIEYDTDPTFSFPISVSVTASIRDRNYSNITTSTPLRTLAPRTTYYVRLVASNTLGTTMGATLSFSTIGDSPSVTEPQVTGITGNESTVSVSVHPGLLSTSSILQYSTHPTCAVACISVTLPTISGNSAQILDTNLTQLRAQTQYFVSVTSTNTLGTVTSPVKSFTTIGALATSEITSHTETTTAITAEVTIDSGLLSGSVAIEASTTRSFTSSTTSSLQTFTSNGPRLHSLTVSGLAAHTDYFIRAVTSNELGTTYSDIVPVRTAGGIPTLSAPTSVSDLTSASISASLSTTGLDTFVTASLSTHTDMSQATEFFVYAGSSSHNFTFALNNLSSRTTYYVTFTASNEVGASTTSRFTFTTHTPVGVLINSDAVSTTTPQVSLQFTTPSGTTAIRVSNYADFREARVFANRPTIDWSLLVPSAIGTQRTVYVQFVLSTGRLLEFSDSIVLGATGPDNPATSPIENTSAPLATNGTAASPTISARTVSSGTAPVVRRATIKVAKTTSRIVRIQTKTGGTLTTRRITANKSGKYVVTIPQGVRTMKVRLIDATGKASNWTTVA